MRVCTGREKALVWLQKMRLPQGCGWSEDVRQEPLPHSVQSHAEIVHLTYTRKECTSKNTSQKELCQRICVCAGFTMLSLKC